ncbi:MAG: beta-lactamase family protein [Nitrosopumilus sp.]|uniref:serine hydrolase domain-containing protein n=1 Tax=Nitrosopumilus sp. TaxID=2024843 RepID=UPI00242CF603|nr:serine hydrolase domain-containing protein [Nitrosopumilus sp.]MCV0366154.1 beta-lactamase family protein [Nitrosopumilus sp.]
MAVEDIIKSHVDSGNSHAISVGLINGNETKFFNYGEIKKESKIAPTSKTIYEIGSMTKTFTTILAIQLEKDGIISLSEPIVKFLPELKNSDFEKKQINLFHLLTHTSGISEFSVGVFTSQMFSLMSSGKSQIKEYQYDLDNFLKYVSKLKLKDNPGSTFRYSNFGFGLVGKILEKVTGKSYEKLVKTHICDAIGMNNTGITPSESQKSELVTGYSLKNTKVEFWNVPAIESAASLFSTTDDMVKFLKANLGLMETSLSLALTHCRQTEIVPKIPLTMKFFTKSVGITLSKFRLGWFVFPQNDGLDILGLDGGTEGFSSFMAINPLKQSGITILTNRGMKPVHKLGLSLLLEMNKK